ncbi:hypothetical protein [Solitalea lacus]|uniref:hypothetical protein n=1 Tax=Solitalea lacus TaxID=2911172 RepID=UPI001EDC09F2|nr:hypothetical protein [Solitalea lacus]UKJ07276.1 hypothetical protein L2B55_17345 [Solitalea lacus]
MKLKHLLILLSLFTFINAYADDPILELLKKKLIDPYSNYFAQERERVYLDINRSEFLAGDNIWFKAYVYNAKNRLPFKETNKLYAELFDPSGKLIERKTLYVHEGTANSLFQLKTNAQSGDYTVRAYTNWMRNFTDQAFYSETIHVRAIGEPMATTPNPQPSEDIDVQLFAEGGTFTKDVDCHFGIKVTLPNGHGAETKGWLINSKEDTLQTFQTNQLGIGEFMLFNAGKDYKIKINYKGIVKELPLPEPNPKGLSLLVNNMLPNKVIASVKTNDQTLAEFNQQQFFVLVHNNGNIYSSMYFKLDANEKIFSVEKKLLGPGVNYITLFSHDFKPIAERLIFNSTINIRGSLSLSHQMMNDSLTVTVNTADTSGLGSTANLSFSILPKQTVGNNFQSSLLADLLLSSSLKGAIESTYYYFESNDYQRQKDLDNLLLTQGWRKYEWSDILFDKVPGIKHEFESGFTINATAENRLKSKPEKESNITLFSRENDLMLSQNADEHGNVSFKNLYLADSSKVLLSASTLKGSSWNRTLKANIIYPRLDSTIAVKQFKRFTKSTITDKEIIKPLTERLFELKEVVIRAEKKKDPFEGNLYRSMNDRVFEINKENYYRYNSIEQILMNEFFLQVTRSPMGELKVNMGRGVSSFQGGADPTLIVDGMVMNDLSYLSILQVQDIEAIAINKSANAMLGFKGGNGSINIVTRRAPIDWGPEGISSSRNFQVKGYAKPVAFYTPKYSLPPQSETFQKYATLFWKPDVQTDSTGKAQFRFSLPKEIKEIIVRTEGISANGTIYFENKMLTVTPGL